MIIAAASGMERRLFCNFYSSGGKICVNPKQSSKICLAMQKMIENRE
jgi:hypothetical protein